MKGAVKHGLIGIGCVAHISHNAADAGCAQLPLNIQAIVVQLYNHFSIYTVRVEMLKSFCDEVDVVFKNLTNHSKTRFLSLLPAVQNVIKMFLPLKEFFKKDPKCPPAIGEFFNNQTSLFWLHFIENQLDTFNKSILRVETTKGSAFEIAAETKLLREKMTHRKNLKFVPRAAKDEMIKLKNDTNQHIEKSMLRFEI